MKLELVYILVVSLELGEYAHNFIIVSISIVFPVFLGRYLLTFRIPFGCCEWISETLRTSALSLSEEEVLFYCKIYLLFSLLCDLLWQVGYGRLVFLSGDVDSERGFIFGFIEAGEGTTGTSWFKLGGSQESGNIQENKSM